MCKSTPLGSLLLRCDIGDHVTRHFYPPDRQMAPANAIIVMSSSRAIPLAAVQYHSCKTQWTEYCKCDYVMCIGFPCSSIGNYRFPILLPPYVMYALAPHQSLALWAHIWSYCHNLSSSISGFNAQSWCGQFQISWGICCLMLESNFKYGKIHTLPGRGPDLMKNCNIVKYFSSKC